ncbi:MAG: ATP-binding protein [Candidatus Aenigmarchaeota archaeon]|nr:ATP-binding protein [Candidatus Aenigmarchaeota archaeon]
MYREYREDMEFEKERKSPKFQVALMKLTENGKLKNMSWMLEKTQFSDFYRFFRRFGRIEHSVTVNREWGPQFKEAVIKYEDFVVTVNFDPIETAYRCTIYHKSMLKIMKFGKYLEKWIMKNNILRGKEFTFPWISKPSIRPVSYINDKTKRIVEENTIIFFNKLKHLKKLRLKTKRGIILYGNPGNGKTSICRYISKNLPGVTRIWVTDWHIEPEGISELFDMARDFSPSIIFLEDIDTIGVSRRMTVSINPMLGKLLNEMDGIQNNNGVVVVATTNNIHVLDEALANRPGRFDLKIHIGNPDPGIIKNITGHEDNITLAEAFRRRHDKVYYEKILGRRYEQPNRKQEHLHYIG